MIDVWLLLNLPRAASWVERTDCGMADSSDSHSVFWMAASKVVSKAASMGGKLGAETAG